MKRNKDKTPIICRCNNVSRGTLETAIREGCDTMNKIFDATTAGVGPCGGSCRRKILPMLEQYLKTGTFPEKIIEDTTGKVSPKATAASTAEATSGSAPTQPANQNNSNEIKKPNSSDENR